MRAVTYQDVGVLRIDDVPRPSIVEPTDVVVRTTLSAICGSDLHVVHGRIPGMETGNVLGHEFIGVVEEVGPDVRKVRAGDRVLASFNIPCGGCWYCLRGDFNRCPDQRVFGYGTFVGDLNGGQAEYVRIPSADLCLHPLDGTLTDEQALFAGDILTTGYECALRGRIEAGDVVMVQGCGPVGLLAVQAARHFGAGRVVAVDTVPARLAMAESFGAVPVNARQVHVPTHIEEQTEGRGADVVLECVGALPAFDTALEAVRPGGRVSIIGVYAEPEHPLALSAVFSKGIDVKFCGMTNVIGLWQETLGLVREGKLDPTAIISHRLPLENALEGYRLFEERQATKVLLTL